jgi:hypothetical protein
MRRRKYTDHPCSLPQATEEREGFLWACSCGRLWVCREAWHLWVRGSVWERFEL